MSELWEPASPAEFADAVRSAPAVLAVGAQTKPRLSLAPGFVRLGTAKLTGMLDYDASEFTFTALAGTPVREIAAALAEKGQYLPFDPALSGAGATLGGTIAAGLSGPGRFRFGGVRDFILGVRFADGEGRLLRLGGKVVKNAAGFDVPNILVGSLGRFGAVLEATFKVFPRPASFVTVRVPVRGLEAMAKVLAAAGNTGWELDALEAAPAEAAIYARIGGPGAAPAAIAGEMGRRWDAAPLPSAEADTFWEAAAEFGWAHRGGILAKIPMTPGRLPQVAGVAAGLPEARLRIGGGGQAAYFSLPAGAPAGALEARLQAIGAGGLTLRGDAPLWLGVHPRFAVQRAVKAAFDPHNRFPPLES
jgi:glycolate oxidase FAD binding subunit